MTPIETLTEKASRNPNEPVTGSDIKVLIQEVRELGEWIQTSNKVLTSRLIRLQRKCDAVYVTGTNEIEIRQSVQQLQTELKTMRTMVNRMQNQFR
jgi:hypothetical protein